MAPDHRPEGKCGVPVRKALLSLLPRGAQSSAPEVLQALEKSLPAPTEAPCMNPRCRNMCSWPEGAGRPQDYCSKACRQNCFRTLERLRGEVEALDAVLAGGSGTQPQRAVLRSQAAKLRWWIRRYPSAPTDGPDESRGDAS